MTIIKNNIAFFKQFLKHPRNIGALIPSSTKLSNKMIENIQFKNKNNSIVEYGAGTGSFTRLIIDKLEPDSIFICIESNETFYEDLFDKYNNDINVFVFNESVENIQEILEKKGIKKVDYIISGIPFASIKKDIACNILAETKEILKENGKFITFQYSLFKLSFFKSEFPVIRKQYILKNFPPAFVLECN